MQCSAILFWNRSRDCSVYTTLEDGVLWRTPAQVFQRTWFLFCLFGVEGVKRTAKSSLPQITGSKIKIQTVRNLLENIYTLKLAGKKLQVWEPACDTKQNGFLVK